MAEGLGCTRPLAAAAAALPALLAVLAGGKAEAADCPTPVAHLVSVVGEVRVNGELPAGTLPAIPVCPGDTVEVGPDSRAGAYLLDADTPLQLDEDTLGRFQPPPEPGSGLVELFRGAVYFLSEVRRTLTIRTPYVTAGVEGTEVYLRAGRPGRPDEAELLVLEGRVAVTPGERTPSLAAQAATTGERLAVASDGTVQRSDLPGGDGAYAALRRVTVGALAWTLFYPDVLVADEARPFPRISDAARLLAAGRVAEAEAVLAGIPGGSGREAALRDALRSTVAFARKDAAGAARLAEAGRTAAPDAATPLVALSYARQLALDLDAAVAAAGAAAESSPRSPLPRARLAELRLMQGQTRAARREAREATALGGGPLADIALGYAELAALRGAAAEAAFRNALAAESANPLALLGLGLARIKQGHLEEGRRQIENAVAHDPSSSLLRSYVGKGYFEERRDDPAAKQLAIAKDLDPSDPTPWFYDAIRKQLDNRPVEALRDVEQSIERNGNRALFRSRTSLDEDAAARAVGLARIYQDLGFAELGRNHAASALASDPAGPAAHRFLADLYQGTPRLEAARASELLQSQLLSGPSLEPLQPSLPFTDLDLIADNGPRRVGFNEFGTLFVRDGVRADAAGVLGSQQTIAGEGTAAALFGRTALSAGSFNYYSDGFRRNFDLRHDIQNLFVQTMPMEGVSLQGEYRRRRTHGGDRRLLFDLDDFERSQRNDLDEDVYRLGGHFSPVPAIDLLVSYIHADRNERRDFDDALGAKEFTERDTGTDQIEFQMLTRLGERTRFTFGAGRAERDDDNNGDLLVDEEFIPFNRSGGAARSTEIYALTTTSLHRTVDLTVRLAWDDVEVLDDRVSRDRGMAGFTPGLGVTFFPTTTTRVRAAVSRTVKRPYAANQTLRPTELAGFNQIYDEFDGTRYDQVDIAAEQGVGSKLVIGASAYHRRLAQELVGDEDEHVDLSDAEDDRALLFAYWTPNDRFAFALEPSLERYRARQQEVSGDPVRVMTRAVPFTAAWFHPSGWYASARATLLQQDVETFEDGQPQRVDDWGTLVDLGVGYRLPERRGRLGLRVDNLLDRALRFQDESLRTDTDLNPRFIPARTILFTATLNF